MKHSVMGRYLAFYVDYPPPLSRGETFGFFFIHKQITGYSCHGDTFLYYSIINSITYNAQLSSYQY